MLTPQNVLEVVKQRLGIPFTPVEYIDDEILNYIRNTSLRTFSRKSPHKNKIVIDFESEDVKTEIENEFRIIDPDGVSIIALVDVLFDRTGLVMSNYPFYGLLGGDISQAEDYARQIETAGTAYKYSQYNKFFEFDPPNILRILPATSFGQFATVIYEESGAWLPLTVVTNVGSLPSICTPHHLLFFICIPCCALLSPDIFISVPPTILSKEPDVLVPSTNSPASLLELLVLFTVILPCKCILPPLAKCKLPSIVTSPVLVDCIFVFKVTLWPCAITTKSSAAGTDPPTHVEPVAQLPDELLVIVAIYFVKLFLILRYI
jgi:hypothetical protein